MDQRLSELVTSVNPKVLKWARLSANKSLSDVATVFKKSDNDIIEWEEGTNYPTYVQLETLAYKIYKRPIAVFFFPEPPSEPGAVRSYRKLLHYRFDNISPDVMYFIRQAQAMQLFLSDLDAIEYFDLELLYNSLDINLDDDTDAIAESIRSELDIKLSDQIRWNSNAIAMSVWRNHIQNKGVFVFKRPFKDDLVSGFCIVEDKYPVIYVNNTHPFSRQIFSLIHELIHVLLGKYGISLRDSYITNSPDGNIRRVESFCNKVASNVLVPNSDFSDYIEYDFLNSQTYTLLSNRYSVSREVILRKSLDNELINKDTYNKFIESWYTDFNNLSKREGGSYYNNQKAYLGKKYIDLAFARYYQGAISREDLSQYLCVKSKSINGLDPLKSVARA